MSMAKKNRCVRLLAVLLLTGTLNLWASAAFTDADQITETEAVNTLADLGVLDGKENGSFDPKGAVTRAEMCKIVCVLLNGGKMPRLEDPNRPMTNFSFSDISGHWARYLIEYCHSLEIVNGRADGTFDPDGTVTGREAAKMLLAMAGHESEAAGFTGADWAEAVDETAEALGLCEGQAEGFEDQPLDREHAALMVYHALELERVSYWEQVELPDGSGWETRKLETPKTEGETIKEWAFRL
mgnify:FL=1